MSASESLTQDMKVESEEKAEQAQRVEKDSKHKEEEEEEEEDSNLKKKKDELERHPVSEPSPSITSHSPSPSPSIRSRKSPSPPQLHSLPDSPISEGHFSAGHGGFSPTVQDKRFSPPPQKLPVDSSPESSISDDHFSVSDGIPPIGDERFSPAPPVVVANRFQVEPKVVTKVDPGAQDGFVGVKGVEQNTGSGGGGGGDRRLRPDVSNLLRSKKKAMLSKALLGLRITDFVFCLVSFSVLAADKEQGWAQDSFYFYKEFKYSLSVNVIGFVYSGLQICDLLKYLITRNHIVEHHLRGYFSFALDQILTYLLMSASSSAATRAYDWESNWGEDKFPYMANASVALSFVAFVAFALTSLVSGSILYRFR